MTSFQTEMALRRGYQTMSDANVRDAIAENSRFWEGLGAYAAISQSGRDYLDAIQRLEALRSAAAGGAGSPGTIDGAEGELIRHAMDQVQDARIAAARHRIVMNDQADFRGGFASQEELAMRHERNAAELEPGELAVSASTREERLGDVRMSRVARDFGRALEQTETEPIHQVVGNATGSELNDIVRRNGGERAVHAKIEAMNPAKIDGFSKGDYKNALKRATSSSADQHLDDLGAGRLAQRLVDGDEGRGLERIITKPLSWITGKKLGTDEAALDEAVFADASTRLRIHWELERSNPRLYPNGLKSYVDANVEKGSSLHRLYTGKLASLPDID